MRWMMIWIGLSLLGSGCSKPATAEPETPSAALAELVRLYEAKDYDTLIRTRYAEIYKAETEEQIQKLVDRFAKQFSNQELHGQVVELYTSLQSAEPEMSEDGSVATYRMENGFLKLSRMPNGLWGFHL